MTSYTAAAIQMNSQPDLHSNLNHAYNLVRKAASKDVRLAALPENFAFLGDEKERMRQAETISKQVETTLGKWAKEFGIYLMGGGYPVPAGNNKVTNRATMWNPDGRIIARYDKIHLFDVELSQNEIYRESDLVSAGTQTTVVDLSELGRYGLSICYDVRFPELYRRLSEQQADVLCIPAAFTRPTGEAHWELLLRARAVENSAYVIAPAQTGIHGKKRKTYGHSMIIDPWGEILADAGTETGIVIAKISTERIHDVRKKLPSLEHRIF